MIEQIDPHAAYERMKHVGAVYLDVRTVQEYEQGHADGAHNIPFLLGEGKNMTRNPYFLTEVKERFSPRTQLIVGCRTGHRSQKACELLEEAGFTNLANDQGSFAGRIGVPGWKDQNLPLETGNPVGRSYP